MINESNYSFNVSDTDQLVYVLERGVKPICKSGSSAQKIYEKMKAVLRQIIDDEMTDVEKVKAIHDYLVMNVTYDKELVTIINKVADIKEYNGFFLEGVFDDKKAVCEGISKSFASLCNMEGIPCVIVEGYQTKNPTGLGHAWNKVYVNGDWYIVDVTSDGTVINGEFEILSYKYFLISEANYRQTYTEKTFTNILCEKEIDIYSLSKFTFKNVTYDFNIESQEELDALIGYFYSDNVSNKTIEFKHNFSAIKDAIRIAFNNNSLNSKYSYIEDNGTFLLIK